MADKTLESLVGGSAFPINYPIRLNMIEPIVEHNGATFLRNGVFETDVENYPDAYVSNMLVVSEQKKIFDFSGSGSTSYFTAFTTDGTFYLAKSGDTSPTVNIYDNTGVFIASSVVSATYGIEYDSINDSFWMGYSTNNGHVREYTLVNNVLQYSGRYVYLKGTNIDNANIKYLKFDPGTGTMFVIGSRNRWTGFNTTSLAQTVGNIYSPSTEQFYINNGLLYVIDRSSLTVTPQIIVEDSDGSITYTGTGITEPGIHILSVLSTTSGMQFVNLDGVNSLYEATPVVGTPAVNNSTSYIRIK